LCERLVLDRDIRHSAVAMGVVRLDGSFKLQIRRSVKASLSPNMWFNSVPHVADIGNLSNLVRERRKHT
jgi:hypothetical protein